MSGRFAAAWARLSAFFRKQPLDREFDAELQAHLELATEENLKRGLPEPEARRQALVSLGGREATRELHRQARGLPWLDALLQDLRFALRTLRRERAFTGAVVLILGLGIGANTAIFSVIDGVLLRRAPVEQLERLAVLWENDRKSGTAREPASVPDFLDFQARSRSFERLAALAGGELNLAPPDGGEPRRLAALQVSHGLTELLGIAPVLGRTFSAAEDLANGPAVVMISESLWSTSFDRDPAVLGKTLRLDERPHTIVGVLPDEADFGVAQLLARAAYSRSFVDRGVRARVGLWVPLQADPERLPRETHPIFVLGRLAPGATAAAAQHELAGIAADLERAFPSNDGRGAFVEPFGEVVFAPVRGALYVLLGAVALVLLVACVNVASLVLARGTTRVQEVAVRSALGGGFARLVRQFLVEGLVLALASALAGVAVAYAGLRALLALAPPEIPRLSLVTIDLRVLLATLLVALAIGVLFGLVPALQARRFDLQTALRSEGRWQAGAGSRSRLRSALVVAETGLAVVLVVGAGLLIKSLWRLRQVDPGFRAEGVLKAEFQLPASRYPVDFAVWPDFKEMHAFDAGLLQRVAALPGVSSAAIAGNHPLDPGFTNSFQVVGREAEARNWPEISVRRVTPGYFATVDLRLRRGRLLADTDATPAAPVLLLNESAAARFFPGREALGAQIKMWGAARTIVGVVADERFQGLDQASPLAIYLPLAQAPSAGGAGVLLVRSAGDPRALMAGLRTAIHAQDPALAVFGLETLDETLSRSMGERRFTASLLALFAALALLLAAAGLHGALTFGVARRWREIGVRMALGAQAGRVLRQVVGEGLRLALAGLALGLLGALALGRSLAGLLYAVSPTDPGTLAAVTVFLAGVALVASYLPARRATRVDPVVALRVD